MSITLSTSLWARLQTRSIGFVMLLNSKNTKTKILISWLIACLYF